ncbi:ribonuclease HII [Halomonas pacifica]|uniref:Ribonuclease HII n=1 Tax=Bisbaumannia pacifica TaxID=77098 RepID=A0A510XAZ6_9GAMM|nr:ribonuclease HII [Halomonas pacifica]MDC8805001.1 ribonuclease HII [Halomonas pacifica]GEK48602.1 ribonuclease HII [Halomonas pacifica]
MTQRELPPLVIDYTGQRLAGVDEVGRGPLVGAVVAAAVILDPARPIAGLNDSKALSAKRRQSLDDEIRERALAFAVAEASPAEVDELNIYHATHLAMRRAIDALSPAAEYLLVDGNRLPGHSLPGQAVVKGDARHPAIAAASILAKVARDAQMLALDGRHPDYGFARHKGYPTREHLAALERLGPLPEHRRSFAPVKRQLALF